MKSIPTKQLKAFCKEAGIVKPSVTLPHINCIRIACDGKKLSFRKTNMNVFISMQCDHKCEPFTGLFDEKILLALSAYTGDVIQFEQKADKITLITESSKNAFQLGDVKAYPNFPKPYADSTVEFSQDDADKVRVAMAYMGVDDNYPHFNAVHFMDGRICASDMPFVYSNSVSVADSFIITPGVAQVIASSSGCLYSKADNYQYIKSGIFDYAFISTEAKTPDFKSVIGELAGEYCEFEKAELLMFCDLVMASTKSSIVVGEFSVRDSKAYCTFNDEYETKTEHRFDCAGKFDLDKRLLIPAWIKALRALPVDTIRLHPRGNHFAVTSPEDKDLLCVFSTVQ